MNHVIVFDATTRQWLQFANPHLVVEAGQIEDVLPALRQVEQGINERGLYAAGFMTYEAAPAFDPALQTHLPDPFPLLWFGLYSPPQAIKLTASDQQAKTELDWTPTVSRMAYERSLAKIKNYIAWGDTYQVNYTLRLRTPFSADPWPFFLELVQPSRPIIQPMWTSGVMPSALLLRNYSFVSTASG
jgi:para-aminobenzoate synthetase/4-amino-4-deoxychorismate lyase